ncbi:MAG: diphthine synthase [Crenarchaeota archaeon]|nr:diphthine synthase [Thermoproteota archaeon]
MSFVLAGAGLRCEHVHGLLRRELERAEEVWADVYTSPFQGGLVECLKKFREDVKEATREVLEGRFPLSPNTLLVVPGDPLAATTHASLLLEAKKKGLKTKIISNVSSLQAARTKSGLSQYRFGRVVTLMYPRDGIDFTESVYLALKDNDELNLHTIVLLETGYGRSMTVPEAAELLCKYEDLCGRTAIAMARLCWDDELIVASKLKDFVEVDLGPPPHLLVFPSPKLHPIEEELLQTLMR